jgi:hypothetical protein
MAAAVATEAEDTPASAAGDVQVLVAAPISAELVVATVEPGLAVLLAAMGRGITHPESQRDGTAATAAMGKDTTHRQARLEARFMVRVPGRKVESLPSSLPGRQIIPVAITSREINPGFALRVNPVSSPVIIRAQNRIFASNAPAQLQGVQRAPAALGHGRI